MKKAPSGSSYFQCLLQSQTSAKRAVCFTPTKHKLLNDVAQSSSPVKILKMDTNINNNDSIINRGTQISLVKKVSFDVDPRFGEDAVVSLGDLFSLAPGQLINIKCHVATVFDQVTHKMRNGEDVVKQDIIISDMSTSIKLVVYGQDTQLLTAGKSYILRNLRLNSFKNTVFLNTTLTKKFEFEEIDEIAHTSEVSYNTDSTIMCKIAAVDKITIYFHCAKCSKKLLDVNDDDESVILKCVHCSTQMLKSKCRVTLHFTLVLNDIVKNNNIALFFPNDQAFMLNRILDFQCVSEKEIVKTILEFPDILEVKFDVTTKSVISVLKM